MTTNRMGLEQSTLSDGELTVITDTDHVQCGDAAAMARELLAYRKVSEEPVAYADPIALQGFSNFRKHPGSDIIIRGREWMWAKADSGLLPLFAAPPLAVTVPDGWQLVPTELTAVMRDAWDSAPSGDDDDLNMQNAYRGMVAAAPKLTNEP